MRVAASLVLLALLVFAAPVAQAAYYQGDAVSLSVGSIPSGYRTYWVSSLDGYLGYGNPFSVSTLRIGSHRVTAYIYRTSDWALVWQGTGTVEVLAKPATPAPTAPTTPTTGTGSYAPGEFEPVTKFLLGTGDAYMVDWIYAQFLKGLRGVAPTQIFVDNNYVQYDLIDAFQQYGVSDTSPTFTVAPVDSIWMRDYGPLFVKNAGKLEVVDILYYPNRPSDDAIPRRFAQGAGLTSRACNVYWEGGNFTADGQGNVFATDRLYTANTQYTTSQVKSMVESAFKGKLNVYDHMLNDGGTQHLDMFFLMTGATKVMINRFPAGHQNYQRMENAANRLTSSGYAVTRLDLADNVFASYSNAIIVNNVCFVPTYGKSTTDSAAMTAYRNAGYTVYGIDCREIITWSGALHCITITVPK